MEVLDRPEYAYLNTFTASEADLPGRGLPWLKSLRNSAITRFTQTGFPKPNEEAWRFTPIDPIREKKFQLAPAATGALTTESIQPFSFQGLEAFQLVFVNGRYMSALSTIPQNMKGVQVGSLASFTGTRPQDLQRHLGQYADYKTHPFTALNTAFFMDGAHIYLAKDITIQTPIHLLFLSTAEATPRMIHPRILIVAEANARATIIENYASLMADNVYFTNAVTEVVVGENARVDHYKLERESLAAFHVATLEVRQARTGVFNSHAILLGGSLVRNNINIVLQDEGAECSLNGFYMASGKQLMDSHTYIDHVKPHGQSREYYKGVLDDQAQAVFDGHIVVQPDAQKTDAVQTNKNLLLSDSARINTKPELKIFANDVKCKHGATVGQISAESLFYLRSRGIGLEEARRLLIYAFASEMIERIEVAPLREGLGELLFQKFQKS